MKYFEFTAEIIQTNKGGAFVPIPIDIKEHFGKGRLKVKATFDGVEYLGSIVNMGFKRSDGSICYIIGILKDIRKRIKKDFGDQVFVTIEVL